MHTYARSSLLSVIVTAVLITVNHLYPLGTRALGLGAVLVVLPTALLWWFRNTRSRVAFAGNRRGLRFQGQGRWIAPANGVVKIGVIVPASGPYAILGNSFLKAVEMARSDLRGTKYRYELVLVDVGLDLAQARTAIQRAITDEKVDAIVGGISRFGQVTKPLATAARIPHTCVCSVTSIGDGAYTFTNIPSPDAEAIRWVREAQRRGIRKIALLTQDYPSINGHVK